MYKVLKFVCFVEWLLKLMVGKILCWEFSCID